ncbi:MAG: DUF3693 domain-containing protein [Plesiomonas sp.]
MNTNELLNAYKKAKGYEEDKQVAADLNTRGATISRIRKGTMTLNDKQIVILAEEANVDAKEALLGIHAEQNENPTIKAVWEDMLKKYKSCGYVIQSLAVWAFAAAAIPALECAQCILC